MEIRDYQAGDEQKILELFQFAFGKPLSEDVWQWRFANNPENKFMIKLMWDGDILAGHYAVSPLKMIVSGEEILTALSMTTMTHPDYGGRGIFGELAECLYNEEFQKNNLSAIWGFPNSNSHYGFLKNLKWKNLEQIPIFSFNTNRIKELPLSRVKVVSDFTQNHETAYKKITSDYEVKVNKTKEFLHWRFISNPIFNYTIFSATESEHCDWFAVAKLFPSFVQKGAYEVDIAELCFPADAGLLAELLFAIKTHFSDYNIIGINCWLPFDDTRHILLEKAGFSPTAPITYSGVRVMDGKYDIMYEPRAWYYSMGDSDVY
jgi:hypothetical protein